MQVKQKAMFPPTSQALHRQGVVDIPYAGASYVEQVETQPVLSRFK